MNHEVALGMFAYRTEFRCLLAYYNMSTVRAFPHHILIA